MSQKATTEEALDISAAEIRTIVLKRMWETLEEREQDEAFAAFWKCPEATTAQTRKQLMKSLAEALRFRKVFIERAPLEKKVAFLKKVVHRKPFCFYFDDFIRAWLVQNRRPLLAAFLGGGSIPNDNGFATEDDPPTSDQFEAGIAAITGKFTPRDITLYLCYLGFFCGNSGFWNQLHEAPSFHGLTQELLVGGPEPEEEAEPEPEDEDVEPEAATRGSTKLDDWLIRLTVATAFQEEGAPDEDTLEDIIEEVVELNSGRHRSLFHRGYFHALFGRDFAFTFPGENTERRQWYACGVIFGLLRRNEIDRCVAILTKEQRDIGRELATSAKTPCGAKILPLLIGPLLGGGHHEFVLRFARKQFEELPTQRQRVDVTSVLFSEASLLLRNGNYAEAEKLIDLLMEFAKAEDGKLPKRFAESILLNCQRRKAQCQQAKGSFAKARELLTQVTGSDADDIPPNAVSDHGLIEGGFRTLAAVLPKPTKEKNAALVESLKKGEAAFQQAIDRFSDRAINAHLCMGILRTLGSNSDSTAQERADHLQHALGGMRDDPEAYAVNEIRAWTEFLLILSLLETAEPSNYQPAEDLLAGVIASPVRFPLYLWERLFEAAGMFDDPGIAIVTARHLLEKRQEASKCLLENAELLAKNESVLTAVLITYLGRRNPVRQVWDKLVKLLSVCLRTEALEAAEMILDQLEDLARSNAEFRPTFIEFLRKSDSYSPAWDPADAEDLLVDLLEQEGQQQEAAEILRSQFYQMRSGGRSHEIYAAREILSRLRDLGSAGGFADELASLLAEDEATAEEEPQLAGTVLYIGGNETQQRYVDQLLDEIGREHPDLQVRLYFPGWDSNWNFHLAKLKAMIDQADVVVINRLVRTQLGRHLRAYCDADHPWLPCTGRGFDSLKKSITNAARWTLQSTSRARA